MIFGREPALLIGLFGALLTLGMAFGLRLDDVQIAGLNAAVVAIASFAIRQSVSPLVPPRA